MNNNNLAAQLLEYASNPGYSHNDYADTMRAAAKSLSSYRAVVASKDMQIAHLGEELKGKAEAVNTLASERAANALLTQECEQLRAALASLPSKVQVPEGWVLVPKEPTGDMLTAMGKAVWVRHPADQQMHHVYAAMLAAAPAPQGEKK